MGNPCAPPLAILFLDRFETQALGTSTLKPVFLYRYIDDYAGLWTHGQKALEDFLAFLNNQHPTLSFTMEQSGDGQGVAFLDTLVTVETRGNQTKLETELYIKPTNSGIILHETSAHPREMKHNIVRNMFHRAYNNSSSRQKETSSIDKIWKLLLENGYSKRLLHKLLGEVKRARHQTAGARERFRGRRDRKTRRGDMSDMDGFISLPYIDEDLLWKVKKIVRKSRFRIRIAWKNYQKLRSNLVRSSMVKPNCPGGHRCHLCASGFTGDCTQRNVVYEIKCRLCESHQNSVTYVGESMRPVRLRFNEHRRDALNKTPGTPLGDHFLADHAQNDASNHRVLLKLKVLYKAQDHPDRKIAESIFIRNQKPPLNSQQSSWPIMRA